MWNLPTNFAGWVDTCSYSQARVPSSKSTVLELPLELGCEYNKRFYQDGKCMLESSTSSIRMVRLPCGHQGTQ